MSLKKLFNKITSLYFRYERHISSISLFGGFVFTTFTLTQVDRFLENFYIGLHLLVAAVGIIVINAIAKETPKGEVDENVTDQPKSSDSPDLHFWMTFVIQFAFGGLFSTFLVFYFRSATLSVAWPFLLLLVVTFLANERLRRHYARLSFQISVLFLSIYVFSIFLIPVLFHQLGAFMFVLSTITSLVTLAVFLAVLRIFTRERFRKSRKILYASIGGIVLIMNVLYFTNLIPPIPLSLKDAGIYHDIAHNADGTYTLTFETQSWWHFFDFFQNYHHQPGEPIYVWTSIYSPTDLDTDIVHRWQHYDEQTRKWVDEAVVPLHLVGGREDGFRTYSSKSNVFAGSWRVDVETMRGQKIGRIKFDIIESSSTPALGTEIK